MAGAPARVGDATISDVTVARTMAATGMTARQAAAALVEDELLAQEARRRHLDEDDGVRWAVVAATAARSAGHARDEAGESPPTADEMSAVTVIHAVVLRRPDLTEAQALLIAEAIRRDVSGAKNASEFEARSKSVATGGARVVVETIGPFGADGKDDRGGVLDPTFVAAAFALRALGDTSPVVATPFGWHTIRLVGRVPFDPAGSDERRRDLAAAVVSMRARRAVGDLVGLERRRTQVVVEPEAEALIEAADVDKPMVLP